MKEFTLRCYNGHMGKCIEDTSTHLGYLHGKCKPIFRISKKYQKKQMYSEYLQCCERQQEILHYRQEQIQLQEGPPFE